MRTLTSSARTKSQTPKGTSPIVVIGVHWASGTVYYSDRPLTFDGQDCIEALISASEITSSGKVGSRGDISSATIVLDDTTGTLKAKYNTEYVEGLSADYYHHYSDLGSGEATLVLGGKIASDIIWDEGERTFEFSIESVQVKGEVGFTPESNDDLTNPNYVEGILDEAVGQFWKIAFGSVRRVPGLKIIGPTDEEPDVPTYYLVNGVASSSIGAVVAHRNCYGAANDELFTVPSGYYQAVLSSNIGGHTVTLLRFNTPLSSIPDENWDDQIYVDVNSSLGSGTATQIEWILETYTTITADAASFASVGSLLAPYPSDWLLTTQQDALSLCEKMAWQARCALSIKNGIAFLKPLWINTSTDGSLNTEITKLKSLKLSFTPTEDIVTVFRAKYTCDYSGHNAAIKYFTYKNNVTRYGSVVEEYDFFIYSGIRQVKVAASFWGYRYSNSWRLLEAICFLPALPFEAFDCIQANIPQLSTYGIRGICEESSLSNEDHTVSIKLQLGSKAGDHSGGQPTEDARFWSEGNNLSGSTSCGYAIIASAVCDREESFRRSTRDQYANGVRIHIETGSITANNVYEIFRIEKNVWISEDDEYKDLYFVGTPRQDNLDSGKCLITKEHTVGYYGWGFHPGSDTWCFYDLNPQTHPNYFDSPAYNEGDAVGTVAGQQYLSKARQGFTVVGVDGGRISVSGGSIDKKLEPVMNGGSVTLRAFDPAEIYGYSEGRALLRVPTEDNLAPGRVIFPITDLASGQQYGLGYNAFDVSAYATGSQPSAPGVEMGTVAGSTELVEGNTGFIFNGNRRSGRNQVRPY